MALPQTHHASAAVTAFLIMGVSSCSLPSPTASLAVSNSATSAPSASATLSCAALDVVSLAVSVVPNIDPLDDPPGPDFIRIEPGPVDPAAPDTIIASGPIFGSMDSREVKTELACTDRGLRLTATTTRSADYHGALQKNELWYGRVVLNVTFHRSEAGIEAVWRMRLTTGVPVDRAQTPPYPEAVYPRILTRTVLRPSHHS